MTNHFLRDKLEEIKKKENLTFSGIANMVGVNRGYVSSLVNENKEVELTRQLTRKFVGTFPEYFPDEKDKPDMNDPEPDTDGKDELARLYEMQKMMQRMLESRIDEMKVDKLFLQRMIESNLTLLADGQKTVQAQLLTIHQWDAIKDGEQKATKPEEIEQLINKANEKIQRLFAANLLSNSVGTGSASQLSREASGQRHDPVEQTSFLVGKSEIGLNRPQKKKEKKDI